MLHVAVAMVSLAACLLSPPAAAAAAAGDPPRALAERGRATLLAQAAPGAKPQQRTLRVAYLSSLSFSPLFLAIEKGYFQAESLALDMQVVQSASDAIAFLGIGQMDLAVGNISDTLFNAIERGVDVKIVASMSYTQKDAAAQSPTPIFAAKALWDAGAVKTMADFKGRKIALNTRGGIVEYQVAQSLRRVGLSIKDVEIISIPFPDMPVALTKGAVDGAIMPEPIATAARQRGIGVVVDPNPAPGVLVTVALFGKNLLAAPEAPVATSVLRALRRAANELQSPEAIMSADNVKIWSKYTKLPAETIAQTRPYVFARDLELDVANLVDQQRFLVEGGRVARQHPVERVVDSRYVVRTR